MVLPWEGGLAGQGLEHGLLPEGGLGRFSREISRVGCGTSDLPLAGYVTSGSYLASLCFGFHIGK